MNRRYDPELYRDYGEDTRRNLARVAEAAVDLDLVEASVLHIDASYGEGAVLVFLPGAPAPHAACRHTCLPFPHNTATYGASSAYFLRKKPSAC